MRTVYLTIAHTHGVISIPFKSLKNLDLFTSRFPTYGKLLKGMNKILNTNIEWLDIDDMCIYYEYQDRNDKEYTVIKKLPLLFSSDNYDKEELKRKYAQYFKDDHKRILTVDSGIRYVNHDSIKMFIANVKDITDREIDLAVEAYFKGDSYKKYRDAYFFLAGTDYAVKNFEYKIYDGIDLSKFETDNDYFNYLRKYSLEGNDERDRAIELLSFEDLEDTKGLFDGNTSLKEEDTTEIDMLSLEALSGMSIDDLRDLVMGNKKLHNKGNGRK